MAYHILNTPIILTTRGEKSPINIYYPLPTFISFHCTGTDVGFTLGINGGIFRIVLALGLSLALAVARERRELLRIYPTDRLRYCSTLVIPFNVSLMFN